MNEVTPAPFRVVGVEEHVALPNLMDRLSDADVVRRGYISSAAPFGKVSMIDKLEDTEMRIADLDAAGVTVQVLSLMGPGADLLPPRQGVKWAAEANDGIRRHIDANPDRYAGLAHLPLTDPEGSADELTRAVEQLGFKGALVNGSTDGRYLDDPRFDPVLAEAEALDVPIYLHPAPSPAPVREAFYGSLPAELGWFMSISGWGWHVDTAVHVLRLLLSGAFQRHPNLKIIIGHLGEGLQVLLPRLDQQFHKFAGFDGVPSEILRKHVWVSTGGFFMRPSFMAALDAFGPDRLLYAVDFPYGSLKHGREFLLDLPIDAETRAKFAHGNADRLLKL